jgi:hypothetical protein
MDLKKKKILDDICCDFNGTLALRSLISSWSLIFSKNEEKKSVLST